MIADIGTRKGVKSPDVGTNSEWICGKSWMRGEICDFPLKTTSEVILSNESANDAKRESIGRIISTRARVDHLTSAY